MKKKLIVLAALLLAVIIPLSAFAETLTFNTTTLDGTPYSSSAMKKYKLTMVNFWGEWCYWCIYEMPDLQRLYEENKDLLILGVWYGNDVNEAINTAKECGVTYPLLNMDSTFSAMNDKLEGYPTSFFYDSNGKLVGNTDGYVGARLYDDWKSIIDGLMATVPDPSPDQTATINGLRYKLDSATKTAELTGLKDKTLKSISIPAAIKKNGVTYKVTKIAAKACKGLKNLTSLTIGKNVKSIGANAFRDCKKLKKITIKTTHLTSDNVGGCAFKNIVKKATIKCPSAKLKKYKTLLIKKGVNKSAAFKSI